MWQKVGLVGSRFASNPPEAYLTGRPFMLGTLVTREAISSWALGMETLEIESLSQ